jgi:hypothetical protein
MHKSGLMEFEAVVAIARLGSFRAAALDLDPRRSPPVWFEHDTELTVATLVVSR